MENSRITVTGLAHVGLSTAITCILGPIAVVLPFSPVPISFGLLAVFLSTCILTAKSGLLSCLIYLLLGFIGLPVFSHFQGGAGVLLGPTGGYLLGYLFIPLCVPLFYRKDNPLKRILPGMLLGLILCYICGTLLLMHQTRIPFKEAVLVGTLPYIPIDIIKLCIAYITAKAVRKRLRKAGLV